MSAIIDSISAQIAVSSIADSLPLYQRLTGVTDPRVLEFPELRVAVLGPILLIEGDEEALAKVRRSATLHVNDMDDAIKAFVADGGTVIDGPVAAAGGSRTIVRDHDGNIFECFRGGDNG